MLGIGDKLPSFEIVGVKPGFHLQEEKGQSAFESLTEDSFPGKWKIIFFYPKDFTFVCPTEIAEFARLSKDFADRDAVVLGGSTDNEFCKLAWRREHKDLHHLPIWQFADSKARWSMASASGHRMASLIAIRSLPIPTTSSSTSMPPTSTWAAVQRTRCACSTRCRPTNCAPATAKWAAQPSKWREASCRSKH